MMKEETGIMDSQVKIDSKGMWERIVRWLSYLLGEKKRNFPEKGVL